MKQFYTSVFLGSLLMYTNLYSESTHSEIDYHKEFGEGYDMAIDFVEMNRETLLLEIGKAGGDPEILIPVIFPEIVRYNLLQDKMEMIALEIFYVNLGKDYSNFSVGPFQMKPSFAEKIELYVMKQKKISPSIFKVIKNRKSNSKSSRRRRLIRLNDLKWQIKYLVAFEEIVSQRFPEFVKDGNHDTIRFFAMAYNVGFDLSTKEILSRGNRPSFPYGRDFRENKFLYSNVALFFYDFYWKRMSGIKKEIFLTN